MQHLTDHPEAELQAQHERLVAEAEREGDLATAEHARTVVKRIRARSAGFALVAACTGPGVSPSVIGELGELPAPARRRITRHVALARRTYRTERGTCQCVRGVRRRTPGVRRRPGIRRTVRAHAPPGGDADPGGGEPEGEREAPGGFGQADKRVETRGRLRRRTRTFVCVAVLAGPTVADDHLPVEEVAS
jgi:hypothetical protein